jgi:DNA repair protein RadC
MKIKELCNDDRPREKMVRKGAAALSNSELLAILLRTGSGKMNAVETAQSLIADNEGRLDNIAALSIERLCERKGIGPGKAVTIAAAFELGRRHTGELGSCTRIKVSSPEDAYRILIPYLRDLDHEECWVIFLNKANILTGKERISSGGMEATVMDSKLIIRRALEKKATGIILAHNHPSGSAYPSTADINQTKILKAALNTCDIVLTDHIIIGAGGGYYSFNDEMLSKGL